MDGAETRQWLEGGAEADKVAQEIGAARQMGIGGVPCFIFERKYALTGAQPPEAFIQVFDRLAEEARADA
jgi:predicted DsbA family dithiol-disulfide isomerase